MPRTLSVRIRIGSGFTVPIPDRTPISATWPPVRTALNDRSSVPAPPTSTT